MSASVSFDSSARPAGSSAEAGRRVLTVRENGRIEGYQIGVEVTELRSIASLMSRLGCSLERAMELLSLSESETERYAARLGVAVRA
ncbi:MAG: hypothetical protein HUK26_08520 [Duodenibacillus sp.]|nr:hypothetical protein [Duodenibacillus sp.]